jgi:uncharacterized membrane protein
VAAFAFPAHAGWPVRAVAAWDAASLVLVGLPWWTILRTDPADTRQRAAGADLAGSPGRTSLLVVAIMASVIALGIGLLLVRAPMTFAPGVPVSVLVGLGLWAVTSAWALLHTAFALHYAHLYYRRADAPGGMEFAGGPPADLDFAYFAMTIGMTFQTSDVVISSGAVRRVVLGHALLAFAFNTVILALVVNLLVGLLH